LAPVIHSARRVALHSNRLPNNSRFFECSISYDNV
jgi:hypothetical protein